MPSIFRSEPSKVVCTCSPGIAPILAREMADLGFRTADVLESAVETEGTLADCLRLNMHLRTAHRVLYALDVFRARNGEDLYDELVQIPWERYLDPHGYFSIDRWVDNPTIRNSSFAALKAKDAIVDQFRDVMGPRPSINTLNPDLRINLHIREDKVQVLFDSSNESLHHRGYRKQVDKAPMNEVLAAGLIQLSGWKADCNFLDCMCGSGTLPIEAAMYAMKIPAGYYRKQWGFMKWDDWDPELWARIKEEADSQICEFEHEIWASDRSPKAAAIAESNINNARLQRDIHLMKKNMEDLTPPEEGGIVIINPPYGDRLEEDDIDQVYENIGNTLKHNFQGYQCWLITDDAVALKHVGLKPSAKIPVWNGPLECRFVRFDIFGGTLKDQKAREAEENKDE